MQFRSVLFLCLGLAACGTMKPPPLPAPSDARPFVYIVFFPKSTATLSPKAAAVINTAAADANRHRWRMVEITGPSTRKVPGYSPGLAGPRIQAVRHGLVAAGVEEKRIARVARSSPDLRADEKGGQRVEIRLVERPD